MRIKYSKHLRDRLSLRKIEYDLPRAIFKQSSERYFDNETGHSIAVMKVKLYNKIREVMVAYVIEGDYVKILTIHAIGENQKENRIESGRWRKNQ